MTDKECIKKLIKLFNPYKKRLIMIIICMVLSSIISILIPIISKNIMDKGFIEKDILVVTKLSAIMIILYIVSNLIEIIKEKKRLMLSAEFTKSLNFDFVKHLLNLKLKYLEDKNNTEILSQIDVDVSSISSLADGKIFYALTKVLSMLGGFTGLFVLSYELALVVIFFIPIKFAVTKKLSKKRKKKYNEYININSRFSSWFGETITGLLEIRNFGVRNQKEKELGDFQKELNKTDYELNMISQYNGSLDNLLLNILQVSIYVLGIILIVKRGLTVGSIFAFVTYSAYVTDPIISILNIKLMLSGIIPSAKRYFDFKEKGEEEDKGHITPSKKEFCLFFENVNFSYKEKKIFQDLSFRINTGEKIAIVGNNGVGKSTLIKLLTRTYTPNSGKIKLNEIEIEEYKLECYRNLYSIVSQTIYLFNSSVKSNITIYAEENNMMIKKALKDSGLPEFATDDALEYEVGDNGAKLSGGQRQKIALARAFYSNREVCILDEANSSADIYYEKQLEELIIKKMQKKTLIMITHRLDILSKVDKIIYLKKNQQYAVGCYHELFSADSEFKEMIINSR